MAVLVWRRDPNNGDAGSRTWKSIYKGRRALVYVFREERTCKHTGPNLI
jgi:hypothetical protein